MKEVKNSFGEQNPSPLRRSYSEASQPSLKEGSDTSPLGESEGDLFKAGESRFGLIFDKMIKIGIYVLAFLTPLFFLPQTANVLELNKQFLVFAAVSVLLVLWLAKILNQRKLEIKKSLLNVFVVIFAASVLVSSVLAANKFQTLLGFGGQISESFLTVVSLAAIFFLVANAFKTAKEAGTLLFVLLCSALVSAVFGFLQASGNFILPWEIVRSSGFNSVGSANALAVFLTAALVLSVTLFIDEKRSPAQLFGLGIVSTILLFVTIALNFANVWWALIGVMMLVVGFGIIKKGRASQTRLIFAMVVLAMALLLTLTKINISGGWLNVSAEVSPSLSATIDIDKGVLADKLFFGSGPSSFSSAWELYRSDLVNQTVFWNVRFNQGISKVFSLPTTLGLVGAAFWVALILFFVIWGAWRLASKSGETWTLAFSFYCAWLFLAAMQFLYPTNLTLEFMFWLLLGVSLFLLKGLKVKDEAEPEPARLLMTFRRESPLASVFSFILVIFLVLAISLFYLGVNYWRADAKFQSGVSASLKQGDMEKGYNEITAAVNLNPFRDTYLNSLSQVALLRVNQELAKPKSIEREQRARQFIADAVNLGKAATDLNAQNPDNWIQRGTVYRAVLGYLPGAEDWMIDSFTQATKLQPKNPYAFFELGRSYLLLSDFVLSQADPSGGAGQDKEKQAKAQDYLNKAEEQFNKAVSVKNNYSPAHYQLALIYDRQGKLDSAVAKMEITRLNFPNDVGVAFQLGLLYYKMQDLSNARAELERATTLDGNYSNARYFLGLIYDRQGNKAAAKENFVKIAELNPDNEEVKKILANLEAGKPALDGIAPPPEERAEEPVKEKKQETR